MSGVVCVRYFTPITPKEEGSIVYWKKAPSEFTGTDLRKALEAKGLPLEEHIPQAYNEEVKGYQNLDLDAVFRVPPSGTLKLDLRLTPLITQVPEIAEGGGGEHKQPVRMANPGPIGLFAFGITTVLLMMVETEASAKALEYLVFAYAMFHGGMLQVIVGFVEVFRNNLFGAVAFSAYGAFWLGWGLYHILVEAEVLPGDKFPVGKCIYLSVWGVFTCILFVQTLFINRCLQWIFGTLTVAFFLLAGGVYSREARIAGGAVGIVCALIVFYTATAELSNDLGYIHLPLGHVSKHPEEHGNSAAGRTAVLTRADPAGIVPLRLRGQNNNNSNSANMPHLRKDPSMPRVSATSAPLVFENGPGAPAVGGAAAGAVRGKEMEAGPSRAELEGVVDEFLEE
uniref:Uncharacterized protein n=1 Tax=Chromera velia CCMP2878 TaxID=1169474 RepID=A0A0G4HH76_9ALVE|eukprot:Cvel_27570.t1-p1 / transcript=Cvel_27570.t1 / gene=Cvel_27570 / organism=Chromera_velia_CCMP2878 / gene_product=Inner membrane protein YaaH, putative / transcript_product=Inner membrane protein YaaH, putative / location=Cvel_scaffold3464:9702-11213(+) / protein_length=396 / sequence_SO=supercontig / SO=protein_coding / is_pseudo=false